MQVVGGEDEVPVLEEAVGVVAGPVAGLAEVLAAIDVELRAGTAGARGAGLPEVLRTRQRDDPLLGNPLRLPELDRLRVGPEAELVVAAEHGHPELGGLEAEGAQRELPGEPDRLLLEVVPEREVAEHLEAGEMAGRAADLLDVRGAEAALGGGEPGGGRGLATEVEGLERLHPGSRQQDAGIVGGRDQRSRGHAQVPALLEEGQIGLPDQLRIHGGEGYATGARCPRPPPTAGRSGGFRARRSFRGRRRDRRRRGPRSGRVHRREPGRRARGPGVRAGRRRSPPPPRPGRRAAGSGNGA